MTPLRQPVTVRGDIPGLLCRGTLLGDVTLLDVDGLPVSMDNSIVISPEPGWTTVYGGIDEPGCERFRTLIWHSQIAIYAALHWLADRGHPCLWMLPSSHGGKVEPWDGLTAWDVSAILVSASVARVAEGLRPVSSALQPWRHDPNPGDTYEEWGWTAWQRDGFGGIGACRSYLPTREYPQRWNGAGWYYYRTRYGGVAPTMSGKNTGAAGMSAADGAALTDGAALLVDGGVAVHVPGKS